MMSKDFQYLKEAVSVDLTELLANDFGMTISEALDTLYGSDTYAKLCNPETGLYFQSTLYIYTILQEELNTGTLSS